MVELATAVFDDRKTETVEDDSNTEEVSCFVRCTKITQEPRKRHGQYLSSRCFFASFEIRKSSHASSPVLLPHDGLTTGGEILSDLSVRTRTAGRLPLPVALPVPVSVPQ
jgi:hypothetical protein